MALQQKLYCSLDIETTGFDPLKDEVLEVGFAFFEVNSQGIKITEEWSQVFKPTNAISPKILGLTGISQAELEVAPKFGEHRDFIQDKLGQAIIVGHNVSFDITFLESLGLKFSGEVIDTLELAQFILPTHHSYNLENLMHFFAVPHEEAHRALADAKATLSVLEKLLLIYHKFPIELKERIGRLIKSRKFLWPQVLTPEINKSIFIKSEESVLPVRQDKNSNQEQKIKFHAKTIYDFPLGGDYLKVVLENLSSSKQKVLLVVPKQQQVISLWKQLKIQPVFDPEHLFNEEKFAKFLEKKDLTDEEVKFLLKVLVWKYTNWQTENILDLNLSFFGGQFRSYINEGKLQIDEKIKVICCDQKTFLNLPPPKALKRRQVIILGLAEFESAVSANISQRIGWGQITSILKSFYNPELETGSLKYKTAVVQGLADTDLYFGLVNAMLQTDPPSFQYYKITETALDTDEYKKIADATKNYIRKLHTVNKSLRSDNLDVCALNLEDFFRLQKNRVKWIELAENRCVFQDCPIEITDLVQSKLSAFSKVAFADALGAQSCMNFFVSRLGLNKYKIETFSSNGPGQALKETKDLFSNASSENKGLQCYLQPNFNLRQDLIDNLTAENLPAAVLFGSPLQIKEFYETFYSRLQEYAFLLTQNASGGTSKIFHNFSIRPNSILLATDKFVLRHIINSNSVKLVENLKVKTLIVAHLPFEQFTHPYQEALAAKFANPFLEFSLPKAVYNFHRIIQFFYTRDLQEIHICDSKINRDYSQKFIEYLKKIPRINIK